MNAAARCPRDGCTNTLSHPDEVVCAVDFYALASSCRGKIRLGEPAAAWRESLYGRPKYRCDLCKQFHTGGRMANRAEFVTVVRDTVRALKGDPRVGQRGVLNLADAWAPPRSVRDRWNEGLDQREAHAATT